MTIRKRPKPEDRSFSGFHLDITMTKPQRVAAFLNWWAESHPHDFAQYNEITKAIEGYKKVPRNDNPEVLATRGIVGRAARILQEKYGRALVRRPSIGARGTVDAIDTIQNKAIDRAKKVNRDIVALAKLDEIIDTKTIPNTPENKATKDWYNRDVRGLLKQVSSSEFLAKLLPPAPPEPAAAE